MSMSSTSELQSSTPELTFPIESLRGTPSSRKALNGLKTRCSRIPEIKLLCERLLKRLEYLHPYVAPLPSTDPSKKRYVQVVVDFIKMVRRTPLLVRLATSETLVRNIKYYQQKLDDVQIALGLDGEPMMTEWIEQWSSDLSPMFHELNDRVTRSADRMLVNEMNSDKKLEDALMTLENGMKWSGLTPEMRELKQKTFDRVSSYANKNGLTMFDWFIPTDSLHYGDTIGEVGTFGSVSMATWTCGGENGEDIVREVVVKQLFPETSASSDEAFLKQLRLWSSIHDDNHILKLYGGNHVSNPQLYVCEFAPNGNLVEFLGKNPGMFWRMFYRVAEGLQYLHTQHPPIVHGGLKCSNILVGADYSAKLTDFGFASVRTLSAGLSGRAADAAANAIRWKPIEVLEEVGNEEPMFESDIYSMGMCMVEAITQGTPYDVDDEQTVMDKILSGGLPDRPDDLSEDTWEIITKLCRPNPRERPSLSEILEMFKIRAEAEEANTAEGEMETEEGSSTVEGDDKLHQTQQQVPLTNPSATGNAARNGEKLWSSS